MIGLVFLLAAVGTATSSLESLNAADLAAEVRPGGINGSPFWNVCARQFVYAPAFDFTNHAAAASYRFSVRDRGGKEHAFTAARATASLAPVWKDIPPGPTHVEAVALDAQGKEVGFSGARDFHRAEPFRPGAYAPKVCGYRACAKRALEWMFAYHPVVSWTTNVFDKTYQLNCFPSKMIPAVMDGAILLGDLDPARRASLLASAENAANWMMANSVREPATMKGLPITYSDYWEETRHLGDIWASKEIAHKKRNQVMMIYPASVGSSFLRLARATGKDIYRAYAREIAERYLALRLPDGGWPLLLEIGTGRALGSNKADVSGIVRFLEEMSDETGDPRYRAAADTAQAELGDRIRTFDWEGQFEDVEAQKRPYQNLTKDIALATCRYLHGRAPSAETLSALREAVRFSEDQFVIWGTPRKPRWYVPGVIEQYNCEVTIDGSYDVMIMAYLELWTTERNPLDLAKARALGDAITRNQMPDGLIPTVFPYDPGRAGRNWLNCMTATVRTLLALDAAETEDVVAVYANSFREGGWKLDVQFMDKMGSPHLLAHGLGSPVPDATATATVPEAGRWRVYVRTRKWVDGAGFFQVLVNGRPLAKTFGAGSDQWSWEDGGEVELEKGPVKITLRDMDGFDGRCAGIVLVKGEGAPKGAINVLDRPSDQDYDFDFVVVGGGLSGCCAAVAAARAGIRVALVQDRPVPGGNASGEVRVWSAGEIRYPLVNELRGKFMNKDAGNALSDQDRIAILEREPKLSCFYWHRAFGVEKHGDGIAAVKALDVKGNRVVRFRAPLFCDATGDGWVGYWAGADWRSGREAKGETGERYAPEKADRMTLGSSIMWDSAEGTYDIPFSAPWAEPYACGQSMTTGRWNWEFGLTDDIFEKGEEVRDRILLAIYGAFSNAKKDPRNAHRRLVTCPFVLGKRESRRLMGDYIFCEQDVTEKPQFEDAVATGSWSIDLHYTIDEKVPFLTRCEQGYFGRYWIPYRSLFSRNVTNLFMAGRCFSCTHVGLGSPRVMNTLAQMGCVVGEAAAMCRKGGYSPRGLYSGGHVRELQRRLGGAFPGVPDPKEKGWLIVDDEDKSVSFEGDWYYSWNCNGGAVGLRSHFALKRNAKAVYPLPVKQKGRYLLKGRVPHLFTTSAVTPARLTVRSDGKSTEIVWNQLPESGTWRDLGTVDLEPGATLEMAAAVEGPAPNGKDEIDSFVADGFALVVMDADRGEFSVADRAVTGDVTVVNVPWQFKDGRIDWLFNPTKGKTFNPEWTWQLNRMHFWQDFVRAYEATKDEKYVRAFVRQLGDWLDQTGGVPPEKGYNDCGSAWRTIEEGLRLMGSWHEVWHAFRSSPLFTPDLQERFKAAALAQARHLLRHHSKSGNWLMMEMNGVYAFASDFPVVEDSARMRKEASERLSAGLRQQILPDGLQYELSPDYHYVTVMCARQMYETAVRSGFAGELPADFAPLLERMADAVLNLTTPSFVQPRFNDCFTMHGDQMVGRLAPLFPARQDLTWLASRRASGCPPAGATASRYLPWSGFAVMRSDWGSDATYLAFDVGPLGRAHAHQDKLSFTLWKGGEELVFDDGGGQYDHSPERVYAISGHDHNTLLVDGLAQQRSEPRVVKEPIDAGWETTPELDRAVGIYDQGFGPEERRLATHRREILFDKQKDAFVITDNVRSADGKEHDYAVLFHLDTTNTVVSADGKSLLARYGRVWNLSLEAAEGGRIETAAGLPAPNLAGWYVGRNDQSNHVATTVFVRAPKGKDRRLVTILRPEKNRGEERR